MQQSSSITRAHLQRLLLLGLGLSALLLLSAVVVALRAVRQMDRDTQTFADQQALEKSAIDEIQRRQARLNSRWLQLARRKDAPSRADVLNELADNRQQMSSALEAADQRAELLRQSIYQEGHGLLRWTVWLFAVCVGLSLVCATWAFRASASLFRRLEQQAAELTRMQYQFLETQENVARRFSHELHDELGQALTAVKANLSRLRDSPDEARILDCLTLVDGAIQNVREMSQLLRPTILDDFGLDAALRSLTESFAQRTGIAVRYDSNLESRRLPEQAETNLFRIAQEALTNVARHAKAEAVHVDLLLHGGEARLTIRDTGRGFDPSTRRKSGGLGLAGMETRARGCGGSLRIDSAEDRGTTIQVRCRAV
ncbi:MAG TPA: sensor histidine kinase [Bryobacteraceae bacterium]|nr:sensor histidine kinase [Bryobacteraceae bacterium]